MRTTARTLFSRIIAATITSAALAIVIPYPVLAAPLTGHLYVVERQSEIQRYPLFGGIPASHSDLTIPNAGPVVAVASDGTVAAQLYNFPKIGFFAPGQTTPERTLNIRPPRQQCAVGLVGALFDAQGHLYVSRAVPDPCYLDGIAVYAAGAKGNDDPIQSVKITSGDIALDPTNGELFDSVGAHFSQQSIFYVFGNLSTHLRMLRTINGTAQFAQGVAINPDAFPHVLLAYTVPAWTANSIAVYDASGFGIMQPGSGVFSNVADIAFTGTVGYWKGRMYSTFAGVNGQGVYVFERDRQPVAVLHVAICCIDHFAVGP